jgi:hypothetical protein
MEPYADSFEHLRDELSRLDLQLRRALFLARSATPSNVQEDLRGLVISEPEIDAMLRQKSFFGERWRREIEQSDQLKPIDEQRHVLQEEIQQRINLTRRAGVTLTLVRLVEEFKLTQFEMNILLVALAPEVELAYETLFGYLQNDVTRKRPSVDLTLNLISLQEREKIYSRRYLAPESALIKYRLLQLGEEAHDRQPPLLKKFLKVEEPVIAYILGQLSLSSAAPCVTPSRGIESLEVEPTTKQRIENLISCIQRVGSDNSVVRLVGESDAALREVAEAQCHALKRKLIFVDLAALEGDEGRIASLFRDATLWDAAIAISAEEPDQGEPEKHKGADNESLLARRLKDFNGLTFLLGPSTAFRKIQIDGTFWRLDIEPPGYSLRRQAWEAALNGRAAKMDYSRLADAFRFSGREIRRTIDQATSLAALRDPANPEPSMDDLLEAGRALTTPQLRRFALRVDPQYTWSDIVLPPVRFEQLRSIAARMKFRYCVHEEWGFGEKLSRGKGLNVLFTGPSGTGKTMAAEVLAGELSLDLYQIDLSSVVSKYIGETEKNLSAIFQEAELSQALLFFDEADALFGKRTEVKDAHDRYANIEVNYLLQRVEQFEGVVILATNLQRNLDDAFLRRMQEVVEFPFPDEVLREQIWNGHFPTNAPVMRTLISSSWHASSK